jgi:flagellin-specific chaperone FliS
MSQTGMSKSPEENTVVLRRKVEEQLEKLNEAIENEDREKARAHGEEILLLIGFYANEDS